MKRDAERLYRAEEKFSELTQGDVELITHAIEPQFVFCDGEHVKGYGNAADKAEKMVEIVRKVQEG